MEEIVLERRAVKCKIDDREFLLQEMSGSQFWEYTKAFAEYQKSLKAAQAGKDAGADGAGDAAAPLYEELETLAVAAAAYHTDIIKAILSNPLDGKGPVTDDFVASLAFSQTSALMIYQYQLNATDSYLKNMLSLLDAPAGGQNGRSWLTS
jgi:hypothetical protein